MKIDMSDEAFQILFIEGVWRDLFPVSGWSAMQRGCAATEPIDLVKAIYIVDLEHTSRYWNDWQDYETFVLGIPLVDGRKVAYINRIQESLHLHLAARENPGQLVTFPPPSAAVQKIIFAADKIAKARAGEDQSPSSCDLLYCTCSQDPVLSESLQQAGLQLEKLAASVTRTG